MDDIPIKPSKEFLEEAQKAKQRQVKQQTNFLKKSKSKCLPCYPQNQKASPKKTPSISKKEMYEQIKAKNSLKYGRAQSQPQPIQQPMPATRKTSKQAPNYVQPTKQQVSIQTEKVRPPPKQQSAKQKYEQLLKQLMKEKQRMEQDKKQLQQQKEYLQFKKQIKDVEGLTLKLEQPKEQPKEPKHKTTKMQQLSRELEQSKKLIADLNRKVQAFTQSGNQNSQSANNDSQSVKRSKAQDMQQLLQQDYEYTLEHLSTIPQFSLQMINFKISLRQFHHTTNKYYKQYLTNFGGYAVAKEAKQGAKSVKQYQNGCMQIQVDKKYRLISFDNYRLTIFRNGDVKQQLPGPIVMYYSKVKQLNRISYSLTSQLYYFYELAQIQMHTRTQNGIEKDVRYKDGSIKHIP